MGAYSTEAEKRLEKLLNSHDINASFEIIVANNSLRVKTTGLKGIELEIAKAINDAIGRKRASTAATLLANIKIDSKITYTGGTAASIDKKVKNLKIGRAIDAKGRYFEYLVFKKIENYYKSLGASDQIEKYEGYDEMMAQKKYVSTIKDIGLDQALESCAEKAFEWVKKTYPNVEAIRQGILQALAQSNSKGDISAFGITLELKTTSNWGPNSSIKYFELKDYDNFGYGLISYVYNTMEQQRGMWKTEDKIFKEDEWSKNIATKGFQQYLTRYLKKGQDNVTFLNYLLQKGVGGALNAATTTSQKTMVVGVTQKGGGSFTIIVDFDILIQKLRSEEIKKQIEESWSAPGGTYYLNWNDSDKTKTLVSFSPEKGNIQQYAIKDNGDPPEKEMNGGNEVAFTLRLNHAFFELANQLGARSKF